MHRVIQILSILPNIMGSILSVLTTTFGVLEVSKRFKGFFRESSSRDPDPGEQEVYQKESEVIVNVSMPLLRPVKLTSDYGMRTLKATGKQRMHKGVDLISRSSRFIISPFCGVVTDAKGNWYVHDKDPKGNYVIILSERNPKLRALFYHLAKLYVSTGDFVSTGDIIGEYGNTGYSFGAHLHFQLERLVDGLWCHTDPKEEVKFL